MEAACDRKAELDCQHYTYRQFIFSDNIASYSGVGKQAGE
jgi:hypothetical protein